MPRGARSIPRLLLLSLLLAAPFMAGPPAQAAGERRLLLILDVSGSMWGQVGGEAKIVVARRVLGELVGKLPAGSEVGLVAYGHRKEGDCADVETVVPPGPLDKAAMTAVIAKLQPKGKTPITTAALEAIRLAKAGNGPATIVLVSDGLETCGGDPCKVVREARAAKADLVFHVVGFDVEEAEVSQLECTAQAGGGLYFEARDAAGLAAALAKAVEPPAVAAANLRVGAKADGKLADAAIKVFAAGKKDPVAIGRTYDKAETNPRELAVPPGKYKLEVRLIRADGDVTTTFDDVVVAEKGVAERIADFTLGELVVGVTRNGALSDALISVFRTGETKAVETTRSYTKATHNPARLRLVPGSYTVEVKSVEISGDPVQRFEAVVVEAKAKVERNHEFKSGTLSIGAAAGGKLVDVTVSVKDAAGKTIASGRTYEQASSNPKAIVVPPGAYLVELMAVKLPGKPKREIRITVEAGQTAEQTVDFGS